MNGAESPPPRGPGSAGTASAAQAETGFPLSLGVDAPLRPVRDDAIRRDLRALPDEHLAGLRGLLQARRDVDRVAADHELPARRRLPAGDDLAGVHADPQADLGAVLAAHAVREGCESRMCRQRRANRALRIILVRLRDPEDREESVADELLGRAAELLHFGVQQGEEVALERAHVFRIEVLSERRRAGEVGEEHGHDAPLRRLVRARGAGPARPSR